MTLLAVDTPILHQNFGEVDLLFYSQIYRVPHYMVIEVKDTYCQRLRKKGRNQLRRTMRALHILQPNCPMIGFLLTPTGYEFVDEAGGIGMWGAVRTPLNLTQSSLETDSQLSF